MREKLKKHLGKRVLFSATLSRYGVRRIRDGLTESVLVTQVWTDRYGMVADHLWFDSSKPFRKAGIQPGDRIQFRSNVQTYEKSSGDRDYKLSLPTRITILTDRLS